MSEIDWTGAKTVQAAWDSSPLLASVRATREHTCCACFTHNNLPCCNQGHDTRVTPPTPTHADEEGEG